MSSEARHTLSHTRKQDMAPVTGVERWASLGGGLWGIAGGLRKGGLMGWGQAILSGMLVYRAIKGECRLKGALSASPYEKHVAEAHHWQAARVVSHSVTVNKPRDELYRFWRAPDKLAEVLTPAMHIEQVDDRTTRWILDSDPAKQLLVRLVDDREGEFLEWVSDSEALPPFSGWVRFQDAPGRGGTEVQCYVTYEPAKGHLGYLADKGSGGTSHWLHRNLRRFKQKMETGEITASRPFT
ncbi:hypothetical protein R5R73_00540 [Salinicola sp. LHM]|jgi:uncharacterized membrane protein|uniref:SRPBCC family protein n=1 Tax=Salinicola TaxID=404432 RepID=UPI000B3FF58C|nr:MULTISPECIES: hypothetical protein [Salinicola]WQH33223.1 hypothetical protein R5R73_00540 [Salinicola sp. LHM]|tara:strand:- start:994 stop:1713 length:720 start_codon:yes stop_codon:yes gene_type:complete